MAKHQNRLFLLLLLRKMKQVHSLTPVFETLMNPCEAVAAAKLSEAI